MPSDDSYEIGYGGMQAEDYSGWAPQPATPRVPVIINQAQLEALRAELGLRFDWHEPDERGVTVEFSPGEFDNAMITPGIEAGVYVLRDGERVAYINLALLFAFATGGYSGIKS